MANCLSHARLHDGSHHQQTATTETYANLAKDGIDTVANAKMQDIDTLARANKVGMLVHLADWLADSSTSGHH